MAHMRLYIAPTAAALAAILACSTASATTEPAHQVVKTRATKRIGPGELAVSLRQVSPTRMSVVMRYTATFKRATTVGFSAWPCRTGACRNNAIGKIRVGRGTRVLHFRGRIPVVRDESSSGSTQTRSCALAQVIDGGLRSGHGTYRVRTTSGFPGVVLCALVETTTTP